MLISKLLDKNVKICKITLKTEQTTNVYEQWDRWKSYDMIKHHMIAIKHTDMSTFL